MKTITIFPVLAAFNLPLIAQIQLVDSSSTGGQITIDGLYTQNFDSLSGTGLAKQWTDNSNLPEWYATSQGIATSVSLGLLSLGQLDGQGDRALGAHGHLASNMYFAVRFSNLSSLNISGVSIEFDGEQWRRHTNNPQVSAALTFDL